jgi:hypothetical protein
MEEKNDIHYRYNMSYLLLICLLAIIVLITVKWGSIPDLSELISFGLTLTSLFLSLIAIVFSIYSNVGFSKNVSDLQETSSRISQTADKLQTATIGMEEKVERMPTLIEGLEQSFKSRHEEVMSRLSERKESLTENPSSSPEIERSFVEKFLSLSSYSGLKILYACKLAADYKIPFKLEVLKIEKNYAYGFLVASTASGLVGYTVKEDVFCITQINEDVKSCIENETKSRMKLMWKDKPDFLQTENKNLEELEKYLTI